MRRSRHKSRVVPEINVVPYIDVMLVLLVIFMITAPLLTQGVHVNLPQAQAKSIPQASEKPVIVTVDSQGNLYLNISSTPDQQISPQELMSLVGTRIESDQTQHKPSEVYIKGDKEANYGRIMKAMVLLQKVGATGVGLITTNPDATD